MYDYNGIDLFALACTSDFLAYPPETSTTTTTFTPPAPPFYGQAQTPASVLPLEIEDFDTTAPAATVQVALKTEVGGYSSSSTSSYGSPAATGTSLPCGFVPRSMSSNSIHQQDGFFNHPVFSYPDDFSHHHHHHHHSPDLWDSDTCPSLIRKVFSTGDLQRVNNLVQHGGGISGSSESPILHENCTGIDGMSKVGRYSAEERKERIERYRSKRHQRNFTKKIKYACRKTLADSRPRIRGRFARNEEIEESGQAQIWYHAGKEENEEEGDVWLNFFEAFSVNLIP